MIIPAKSNIDEELTQLAISAQQHPPMSLQRRVALNKLVSSIIQSGKLSHPHQYRYSQLYQDIEQEAYQNLFFYLCQNIEKFDPSRASLITWLNFLLTHRFFQDAHAKIKDNYLDQPRQEFSHQIPANSDQNTILSELVREYLESDPENILKNEYIRNHPKANYQCLALRRFAGQQWREIAADLNLSISTLSRFYQRSTTKFAPKIRSYCG